MSTLNNSLLLGADAGGYQISRSLRFNSADSAYLSRTPASAGNRQNWTWSGWVKRSNPDTGARQVLFSAYGASNDTGYFEFGFDNSANLGKFYWSQWTVDAQSAAVFRDFSAWYHIVVSHNGSNIVVYVNGTSVLTSAMTGDLAVNGAFEHGIGRQPNSGRYFSGYLADIHFIDGQALTPSSFAETNATTGQWVPKAYTGSYGTNGFRLDFSDNSAATATTLGKDRAGSNNWTPNNLSVTAGAGNDSLVDTPTSYGTDTGAGGEVRGNYCTLNPLDKGANVTLTNGNLDVATASTWNSVRATFGLTSGKWYWEYTMTAAGYTMVGIGTSAISLAGYIGQSSAGYAYYSLTGNKWNSGTAAAYGNSFTTNDVISVAFDADAGKIWFAKNGTWQASGDPVAGTNAAYSSIPSGSYFPTISQDNSLPAATGGTLNAGARPFAYTAPSGFKALCDTNLPAPVVAKPNTVMDVALYTGNGSTQTISGLGFSPDLVWLRNRSQASNWVQFDTVRGALNRLCSNLTVAEASLANSLTSFDSTGFTYGSEGSGNNNGDAFAAFCWDAGSSTVTNTQGSITSQVRANASAGFSIVTYTGTGANATVGHGLGVTPSFIIVKSRSNTTDWQGYHGALGKDYTIQLMSTGAAINVSNYWNGGVSSTTFGINGAYDGINANGYTYVAYCFSPVAGYSSFGSYTGNGSTDGPFVYLGFRPRWILFKNSSVGVENWWLHDTARNTYNVMTSLLLPDSAGAEATNTAHSVDALSNGFKIRTNAQGVNGVHTIVYAAFAENPFQYARAR